MLQLFGYVLLLVLMMGLQLIWTLPLWGLQSPPLFLLLAGCIALWKNPRLLFYFLLVLASLAMDYLMGEGVYTTLATLLAAQPPLWRLLRRHRLSLWRFLPVAMLSIVLFESALAFAFGVQYPGAFAIFGQTFLPTLWWNTLATLLLYGPISAWMNLLHYQESDYLQDAFKGNLG